MVIHFTNLRKTARGEIRDEMRTILLVSNYGSQIMNDNSMDQHTDRGRRYGDMPDSEKARQLVRVGPPGLAGMHRQARSRCFDKGYGPGYGLEMLFRL